MLAISSISRSSISPMTFFQYQHLFRMEHLRHRRRPSYQQYSEQSHCVSRAWSSSYLFRFRCELCYWFRCREILLLLRLQLGPENFIKICFFSNCFHVTHLLSPLQVQAGASDKLSNLHTICNRFGFNIKTLALSYQTSFRVRNDIKTCRRCDDFLNFMFELKFDDVVIIEMVQNMQIKLIPFAVNYCTI